MTSVPRKAVACLALICAIVRPASASDWVEVSSRPNAHSGVAKVQVDMDSLRVTVANEYHGVMKTFWMRRMYADGAKDLGHITIDCAARTYVLDSSIKYDRNGAPLGTYNGDYRSAPIPPDTDFDAIRELVCF